MRNHLVLLGFSIVLIIIMIVSGVNHGQASLRSDSVIDPSHIEQFMQEQVDIGPRHPGSQGSLHFKDWLLTSVPSGWNTEIQNFTYNDVELRNYWITWSTSSNWPAIMIGAHYDSRMFADKDPQNPTDPVPGANDGASGVAAILEMMDHIPEVMVEDLGFVLFDGEDQGSGGMPGWSQWIVGSTYFADQMTEEQITSTDVFILYDMIADDELILKYERNSDETIREKVWDQAISLGYDDIFKKQNGPSLIDDHIPFLELGIPSVDIIDFDYPEWHTTQDDMDHVSAENAAIVVDVVLEWIMTEYEVSPEPNPQISSSSTMVEMPFLITFVLFPIMFVIKKSSDHYSSFT